jgi:hypothetical protein
MKISNIKWQWQMGSGNDKCLRLDAVHLIFGLLDLEALDD